MTTENIKLNLLYHWVLVVAGVKNVAPPSPSALINTPYQPHADLH